MTPGSRELLSSAIALMLLMVGRPLLRPLDAQEAGQRPANPHRSPGQSPNDGTPVVATDAVDPAAMTQWASGRYRLTPSDVLELRFPYVPEFDQTVTVQPDGYISLRGVGELRVYGRSLPALRLALIEAYAPILKEPVINIVLKEFEKPSFFATGEVMRPGKYELRGATTLTQALASAGGLTSAAKHSQVILFRRYSADWLEVKQLDVKKMYASRDLSEDPLLQPGDSIFVPKSAMGKIAPFIPRPGIGIDINPF